jgi:hypothetical protein
LTAVTRAPRSHNPRTSGARAPAVSPHVAAGVASGAGICPGKDTSCCHMMALACRDFPRGHAKFIDIPITDDHLDRGRRPLIVEASDDVSFGVASPVVAWLLGQTLKLILRCIGIVSHDSPHQFSEIMLSMLCGGNHPRHYQSPISSRSLCFGHSRIWFCHGTCPLARAAARCPPQ